MDVLPRLRNFPNLIFYVGWGSYHCGCLEGLQRIVESSILSFFDWLCLALFFALCAGRLLCDSLGAVCHFESLLLAVEVGLYRFCLGNKKNDAGGFEKQGETKSGLYGSTLMLLEWGFGKAALVRLETAVTPSNRCSLAQSCFQFTCDDGEN